MEALEDWLDELNYMRVVHERRQVDIVFRKKGWTLNIRDNFTTAKLKNGHLKIAKLRVSPFISLFFVHGQTDLVSL